MADEMSGDSIQGLSDGLDDRSRKTLCILMQRLSAVGQESTASALGVNQATVSRMAELLPRFAKMMTHFGLKPVDVQASYLTPEHRRSVQYFAKRGIEAAAEGDTDIFFERGK